MKITRYWILYSGGPEEERKGIKEQEEEEKRKEGKLIEGNVQGREMKKR